MNPDASHASPSDSAQATTNVIKEKPMSNEASAAESAVAGSSASTPPAEEKKDAAAPTDPPAGKSAGTPADPNKKKRIVDRYGTTNILTKASEALAKAQDMKDAVVVADVLEVQAGVERVKQTRARMWVTGERLATAEEALKAMGPPVGHALTPIASLLQRRTSDGGALYRDCKVNDDLVTATTLLEKVELRAMGIDPHLVGKLEAAVNAARPTEVACARAATDDQAAKDALVAAKRALEQSIIRLNASRVWVKRHPTSPVAPPKADPKPRARPSRGPKKS